MFFFAFKFHQNFFRVVFSTVVRQVGDHIDFAQEEQPVLQCRTMMLATCVVVHVSCTDNTPPHARISTLFSVRTLHVITRVAQDILRASKVMLSSVMSLLNIPSTPFPHFLFTYCLTDATDWNQIKTLCSFRSGMDCLAIWPVRSQTQGMSPSSASMSVASTRRSTFRPETSVSR